MEKQNHILFFPTNYRHLIDFERVFRILSGWTVNVICFAPYLPRPGIRMEKTINDLGFPYVLACDSIPRDTWFKPRPDIVIFGAAFDLLALRLLCKSHALNIPSLAIEEVSQLMLNNNAFNLYSFPFDRIVVANEEEFDRFVKLGKKPETLVIGGLQCYENLPDPSFFLKIRKRVRAELKITDHDKLLSILCPALNVSASRHSSETHEIRAKYFSLIAAISENWRVLVRLHPIEYREEGECIRKKMLPKSILCPTHYTIYEVLAASDAVITRGNSQVALEALVANRPTAIINPDFTPFSGTVIPVIKSVPDLKIFLKTVSAGKIADIKYLKRYIHFPLSETSRNIAGEIISLTKKKYEIDPEKYLHLSNNFIEFGRYYEAGESLKKAKPDTKTKKMTLRLLEIILNKKLGLPDFSVDDDNFHLQLLYAEACVGMKEWNGNRGFLV